MLYEERVQLWSRMFIAVIGVTMLAGRAGFLFLLVSPAMMGVAAIFALLN